MNHKHTHHKVLTNNYLQEHYKIDNKEIIKGIKELGCILRKADLRIALLKAEVEEKEMLGQFYITKTITNNLTDSNISICKNKSLKYKAEARADKVLLEEYIKSKEKVKSYFEEAIKVFPDNHQLIMKKYWLENIGLTKLHSQIDLLGIQEEEWQEIKKVIKELDL